MAVARLQEAAFFTQVLRRFPGTTTALVFNGVPVSFADLRGAADAAAVAWHAWGVRPGDRVAWLGANHPAQLALLFGLARIGAALVPPKFRLAPAELQRVLADCSPAHLVHDAEWSAAANDLARAAGIAAHPLEQLAQPGLPDAPDHGSPDAPVLLVSPPARQAGRRRPCTPRGQLAGQMAIAAGVQEIGPADAVLTVLPLFQSAGCASRPCRRCGREPG